MHLFFFLQVILIHLSNLTGLGQYNKRTMRLLVSDIGTSGSLQLHHTLTGWLARGCHALMLAA